MVFSSCRQDCISIEQACQLMEDGKRNEAGVFPCQPRRCDGDGGNRTRVRRIRSETSTSLVGSYYLARGDAVDHATPGPSRWEPKLPLERPYRRWSAARWHCDVRSPARQRKVEGDVTVFAVSLFLDRIKLPKEQPRPRPVELASKCSWHFGMCAPLLTRSERPGLPSVTSLPRRSLSSPWQLKYRLDKWGTRALWAALPPAAPPSFPTCREGTDCIIPCDCDNGK
jgi:hypothetical protein